MKNPPTWMSFFIFLEFHELRRCNWVKFSRDQTKASYWLRARTCQFPIGSVALVKGLLYTAAVKVRQNLLITTLISDKAAPFNRRSVVASRGPRWPAFYVAQTGTELLWVPPTLRRSDQLLKKNLSCSLCDRQSAASSIFFLLFLKKPSSIFFSFNDILAVSVK